MKIDKMEGYVNNQETIKYEKNPNQLSPQFGHEEDLTQLAEAELSIEEVLNELRTKKTS